MKTTAPTAKIILVLTTVSRRDQKVADEALHLAVQLKADLLLFNSYDGECDNLSNQPATVINLSISRIMLKLKAESLRLSTLYSSSYTEGECPGITVRCTQGVLAEDVGRITLKRPYVMAVMGGRMLNNSDQSFCVDVNEILRWAHCPVLVVPEEEALA